MGIARKPVNYIDNAQFLDNMKKYIEVRERHKMEGIDPPKVPEVIGAAFVQIATRLASRYNFQGYSYRDEMMSDGILNALEAVNSFDPAKSSNPFAYFTQVIFWAFLRRIAKEKKERAGRDSLLFDGADGFTLENGDEFNQDKSELFMFYNQ